MDAKFSCFWALFRFHHQIWCGFAVSRTQMDPPCNVETCSKERTVYFSNIVQKCTDTGYLPDFLKLANLASVANIAHVANVAPGSLKMLTIMIGKWNQVTNQFHHYLFVENKIENIISNQTYSFLDENRLISSMQSCFRPEISCTYQLISIISDIRYFENTTKRVNSLNIYPKF